METKKISELREQIKAYNDAYRKGQPIISDAEYDSLIEKLKEVSPNDELFEKGVIEDANERMEILPLLMYSLDKVKSIKALRGWLEKVYKAGARNIVITPKYDGISLLADEFENKAWTRGDGVEGQRCSLHYKVMNNGRGDDAKKIEYTWGEAIIRKSIFTELQEDKDFSYKNARNMVAGLFNSSEGYNSKYMPYVRFVRYGCEIPENKSVQLDFLAKYFYNVTPYEFILIEILLDEPDNELEKLFDELHDKWCDAYKIDGLVLDVNEYEIREKMGRLPNLNPAYTIAYKRDTWCDAYITTVKHIEWGVSKDGVLNPVIVCEPVQMEGVTVSRVTGYNAAYIIENHICSGAIIEITRSGDVIPKHLKTIAYNRDGYVKEMENLALCPSCGCGVKWGDNHVNLICTNPCCKERNISEIVYFWRTLGCEGFDEPIIRKLYENGCRELKNFYIFGTKNFYSRVLGSKKGEAVLNEIMRIRGVGLPLAKVMTAYNIFNGKLAEKTCQYILDNLPDEKILDIEFGAYKVVDLTVEQLTSISGIGETTAIIFLNGLRNFINRMGIKVSYVRTPQVKLEEGVEKLYVCMTGFRDKALEKAFTDKGHEIVAGVTKKCNLLVVKDKNSTSSKMQKAQKEGIRIVTIQEANEILLHG